MVINFFKKPLSIPPTMPFQEENDHCPCKVDDGKKAEQFIRVAERS